MGEIEGRRGSRAVARPRHTEDFDALYNGVPPWDIGGPQPTFVELAAQGLIRGRVLDVGCGTGEHALMAAAMGLDSQGIDAAPAAIAIAREKANDHRLDVNFVVGSALELGALNEQFDTVIDSGLFHIFEDSDRRDYAVSLHAAMRPGGALHMLCFSDQQPGDWGPRRITQQEIRVTFHDGWQVVSIVPAKMVLTVSANGAAAWRATITRI